MFIIQYAWPSPIKWMYLICFALSLYFFGNDKEVTILKNKIMQAFILKHFHLENSQYNRAQNVLNCSPINFLYRRSVLIVFFNVITPLYRPASWCVLILLFIGMVSKKKEMHISFSRYSCNKFSLISVLTYFTTCSPLIHYIIWILTTFLFHKNPQFLIILHPVQLQHNLNPHYPSIKMYFANNNCCTKSTSVLCLVGFIVSIKKIREEF